MTEIQKMLFELRDEKYGKFQGALIPNIEKERIIGVRTPALKKLAKALYGSAEAEQFMTALPHQYFEENQLHAFLLGEEKDFDKCLEKVKNFLPFADNWATCDQLSPKCFYKHAEELENEIEAWIHSKDTYAVRFGIVAYMRYFLDKKFDIKFAERVANIKSDDYYINMAAAWYFATALAKQWESIFPFIRDKKLDVWVHNKAIQKALESFRISDSQKDILKGLKIRNVL